MHAHVHMAAAQHPHYQAALLRRHLIEAVAFWAVSNLFMCVAEPVVEPLTWRSQMTFYHSPGSHTRLTLRALNCMTSSGALLLQEGERRGGSPQEANQEAAARSGVLKHVLVSSALPERPLAGVKGCGGQVQGINTAKCV